MREDNAALQTTVTYLYDKGGNIVSKTVYPFTTGTALGTATDTIAYTYDSVWKDQLTSYDGETIYSDPIGNAQSYTQDREFEWFGRSMYCATLDGGDTFVEYNYDVNGLRNTKHIYDDDHPNDPLTFHYFWSDDNRLLGYTYEQPGTQADDYSVIVLYNTAKEPIGFTVDNETDCETYYYLKNIQGDVLCVTDITGTPLVNYTYDAWGAFTMEPASPQVSSTDLLYVSMLNPVTYRGYFYDLELGLYYLQSRYYDPETGRFISADYFEMLVADNRTESFCNLFSYTQNNPVCKTDRFGLSPEDYAGFVVHDNGFSVNTSSAFLSKGNCMSFSRQVIRRYGVPKRMGNIRMSAELFSHAMAFYKASILKRLPIYKIPLIKKGINEIIKHSNPIDVYENEKDYLVKAYYAIWWGTPWIL